MNSTDRSYVELILINGHENYANCDGKYYMDTYGRKLNNKIIWINESKNHLMGSIDNGMWVVTSMQYLDGLIQAGNSSFGGFQASTSFSSDEDPKNSTWEHYTLNHNLDNKVIENDGKHKEGTKLIDNEGVFELLPKSSAKDFAGVYNCAPGSYINNRHVYVKDEDVFIFWAGTNWAITDYGYLNALLGTEGNIGYLDIATNSPNNRVPDGTQWADYHIKRVSGIDPGLDLKDKLASSSDWQVIPKSDIRDCYKAVYYDSADINHNCYSQKQ